MIKNNLLMEKLIDKSVPISLVDQDGNAFSLMAYFRKNALKNGWNLDEVQLVLDQAVSGNYDHLVATLLLYCDE